MHVSTNTRTHGIKALVLDAFGTVIEYGPRLAPYSRLLSGSGEGAARLPFLTRDRFEDAEATFGFLLAAFGIGGAVGSLVVSSLRLPRRYLTFMIACWGGGTLPLVAIGIADSLIVMLAALFIVGAATGAGVVIWGTLLQRLVPLDMIGRVASLDFFVSIAFMPVSIAIAGPLSLLVPVPVIFVVSGVLPPLLAVIALTAGRMRQAEAGRPLDAL